MTIFFGKRSFKNFCKNLAPSVSEVLDPLVYTCSCFYSRGLALWNRFETVHPTRGVLQIVRPKYNSFIPAISIALIQVLYYSEALPTTARILYRSFTPKHTGICK